MLNSQYLPYNLLISCVVFDCLVKEELITNAGFLFESK